MGNRRIKIGITLAEETLKRLDDLCRLTGLDKSYAISLAINTYYAQNEELKKMKGENREK
jgi:predicted DNA-binding protein